MKPVTNRNFTEALDLNGGIEAITNENRLELLNLNGGNVSIEHVDKIFYQDQRATEPAAWESFKSSFARGAGWAAGASLISLIGYVSYAIFTIMRAVAKKKE